MGVKIFGKPAEREIRALMDALQAPDLSNGVILSNSQIDSVTENGVKITTRSLAEWLLEN
jgi:hypothetical protein